MTVVRVVVTPPGFARATGGRLLAIRAAVVTVVVA
jgi:hypothetical protein